MLGVLVLAVGVGACAGSLPLPTPDLPGGGDPASAALITRGYGVYTTDCASCHRARVPRNYSKERWDRVLPRMESRAKLARDDARAVEAYIGAALKAPPGVASK